MVDGKENDKFDLGVKGLKLFNQPLCICSGVVVLAMEVSRFWFTITWSFTLSGIFGMD